MSFGQVSITKSSDMSCSQIFFLDFQMNITLSLKSAFASSCAKAYRWPITHYARYNQNQTR